MTPDMRSSGRTIMSRATDGVDVLEDLQASAADLADTRHRTSPEFWPHGRYLGPARVVRVAEQADRVFVVLDNQRSRPGAWARVATGGDRTMVPGEEVLVIGDQVSGFYVIGAFGPRVRAVEPAPQAAAGAALRCEYDEATNKARITVDAADLEFVSPTGSISFVSGKGIRLDGDALRLDARSSVSVRGEEVQVAGERGAISLKQATYSGESLSASVGRLRWIADRIESTAGVVIEQAKNVYRTVEQLSQMKAGRVRMLIASTLRIKAKNALVKAEEDYRVAAERIDLG